MNSSDSSDSEDVSQSAYQLMWDMSLDQVPVAGFARECYMAGHKDKHYNARLWSKIHLRSRIGIKKFMKPGFTIKYQEKRRVQKFYRHMHIKFPDAEFPTRYLRTMLMDKLGKVKKKPPVTPVRKKVSICIGSNIRSFNVCRLTMIVT